VVLYNGTNADDLTDPTRLGLLAASHHRVESPCCQLDKASVRRLARVAKLPNWNLAAAPCLRSRLATGVPATTQTLGDVEAAEAAVREALRSARVKTCEFAC
jgi:PP-loop superfamily ATP-utilizing enzyme